MLDRPNAAEAEPKTAAASGRAHVLLAEDNEINTLLACAILEQVGFSVECVANGADAVQAATSAAFDLILMDVQMPQMDGLEATRLIRALEGQAARTPIIAMTANASQNDKDACLAAGMNDFVSKPFDPEAFVAVLARIAAQSQDAVAA
jgi:CheY-like chemotaxis protein